jgi:hypothetical protein
MKRKRKLDEVTTPTNEFVGIYGLSTDGVKVIWAGHDSSRL